MSRCRLPDRHPARTPANWAPENRAAPVRAQITKHAEGGRATTTFAGFPTGPERRRGLLRANASRPAASFRDRSPRLSAQVMTTTVENRWVVHDFGSMGVDGSRSTATAPIRRSDRSRDAVSTSRMEWPRHRAAGCGASCGRRRRACDSRRGEGAAAVAVDRVSSSRWFNRTRGGWRRLRRARVLGCRPRRVVPAMGGHRDVRAWPGTIREFATGRS